MTTLGYKLMAEEHDPRALVRNLVAAEAAGFEFSAISDHFSPWVEEQGHASFAWSVLGAMAQATSRIGLMTAVTCPIMRYHPAIIAQAAATLAILSEDRFVLGLGAGERLNEHVVGQGWPGFGERHDRLGEALEIIQGLLTGELSNYRGRYLQLDHARLFDRPQRKPPVILASGGPEASRLAAHKADGLIATEPKPELVEAYRKAGGQGPCYAEISVCFAPSQEEGLKTARHYSRWAVTGWKVMAELPSTEAFAAATEHVAPEMMAAQVPAGSDPKAFLQAVEKFQKAGFDHLILSQIGPDQAGFIEFFRTGLAPALKRG
ncbi:TIGR03557 family F420-dependent LLM class oxidoreductase [Belnapia sp. T6]|uniref:TIGR03557 family F420-dependent LLM class oxidoreductase n=1 Tax=Belnapia mucosa TaxID=2804532 RepID=A0ABS1VBQ9_9PROT|nr:TIGR03557 family F420-dependent LLM class oxidoreductase [Belnapia mucosa]MBL6457823.1 TIGR03557 family F420-dependent LLM class oxidoreductase [Belnapia mucosa]